MSFLQLKRKFEEDPKEILVLAYKKGKLENIPEETSIFELTGIAVEKNNIDDVIQKKCQGFNSYKLRKFDLEKITSSLRSNHLQKSKLNRLEILNCKRNIKENEIEREESIPVIDLSNDDNIKDEKDDGYVYDVYYSAKGINLNDDKFIQNCLVHEINANVWEENSDSSDNENLIESEDDENDENNWRNEYPDEDECFSENSDEESYSDLSKKFKNTNLSDNSLSSDEFDESVHDTLFNLRNKYTRRNSDFDYYNEVMSDDSNSS